MDSGQFRTAPDVVDLALTRRPAGVRLGTGQSRRLSAIDIFDVLTDLLILPGIPAHISSDNRPGEFVAKPSMHPRSNWTGHVVRGN